VVALFGGACAIRRPWWRVNGSLAGGTGESG
jgi:hypothetical protein